MTQALGNITSANAQMYLVVDQLYPAGVPITNFSADSMMTSDDMEIAQVRMGVDGGMAAGYVANPYAVTITLEASSPSLETMQSILQAMKVNKRTYECKLVLTIPASGQVHVWSHGVLTNGNPVPAPKRFLTRLRGSSSSRITAYRSVKHAEGRDYHD